MEFNVIVLMFFISFNFSSAQNLSLFGVSQYYGEPVYTECIQKYQPSIKNIFIPARKKDMAGGTEFMKSLENLKRKEREQKIYEEFASGNVPEFMRNLIQLKLTAEDDTGATHVIYYQTMPDYLSIGNDSDYCRVPMEPATAQKIADLYGMILPTSKLVDNIYSNCTQKLDPVYYPWSEGLSETIGRFIEHNQTINEQLKYNKASQGELIGGIKKDVVLSNKIADPDRSGHVVIYGWHKLDGNAIQPLSNVHVSRYKDYSHGIRLLNSQILLDGNAVNIEDILKDKVLFKLLSEENAPMIQTRYSTD